MGVKNPTVLFHKDKVNYRRHHEQIIGQTGRGHCMSSTAAPSANDATPQPCTAQERRSVINIFFLSSPESILHFGPFVCLFVCLHRTFFSATTCQIHTIFTTGATTRAECFNDNDDVIGHVVWQPCLKKKGKTLDLDL